MIVVIGRSIRWIGSSDVAVIPRGSPLASRRAWVLDRKVCRKDRSRHYHLEQRIWTSLSLVPSGTSAGLESCDIRSPLALSVYCMTSSEKFVLWLQVPFFVLQRKNTAALVGL